MISELVSEFMPDDVLACGESGGGKAKSGIIGSGFWRLAGWEFDRWSDPICLLIVGQKNDYFETEKWWYRAVQRFVCMCRQLAGVVSIYVGWGFVCGWVLS